MILMKRVVFTWLIADGDMHLKNMAVLKIAGPGPFNFPKASALHPSTTR